MQSKKKKTEEKNNEPSQVNRLFESICFQLFKTAKKDILDPFTGCFITKIPITVAYMRFSLKAASLFRDNLMEKGLELVKTGAQRLSQASHFIRGENSDLKKEYEKERRGWNLFYDTLDAVENALEKKDPVAIELRNKAQAIIRESRIAERTAHRGW